MKNNQLKTTLHSDNKLLNSIDKQTKATSTTGLLNSFRKNNLSKFEHLIIQQKTQSI